MSFIICTHPLISLGTYSQGEWGGRGMWYGWERREVYKVLVGKPEGKRPLEDRGVDGRMRSNGT
jgi:hypothetical protein